MHSETTDVYFGYCGLDKNADSSVMSIEESLQILKSLITVEATGTHLYRKCKYWAI